MKIFIQKQLCQQAESLIQRGLASVASNYQ
jgi:hypothetical protein